MKSVSAMLMLALLAAAGNSAAQQAYPGKPIRMISPYPPGGSVTAMARLVSQKLTDSWGQQVIVDNRPGGNTVIGAEALVRSAPDGYTLMTIAADHVIVANLVKTPFDAIKDFAPVATIASSEYVLVVHPSVPAGSLQELIALAKARPGQLNYATSGNGTGIHMAAELLKMLAGFDMQQISYKGSGPALTDLMGGQVQVMFSSPVNVIQHIRNGRLKAIAYAGDARSPVLPQLPTFAESGLSGFEMQTWFGVLAPAATPNDIISKLSTEITRLMGTADAREQLTKQGLAPFTSTPDQFAALMRSEMTKFSRIIKTAGIKLDN